nr:hypothetical protein [Dinophyceae sp. MRD-151]
MVLATRSDSLYTVLRMEKKYIRIVFGTLELVLLLQNSPEEKNRILLFGMCFDEQ